MLHFRRTLLASFLACFLGAGASLAAEKQVTLGTADVSGIYYPTGGAICRLINRGYNEHGIRCTVQQTAGSISNLEALRKGTLDLGLTQSDWLYHAYRGTGPFAGQGPNTHLRTLFALHGEPFTALVRADAHITRFDQLKGKRISVGNAGSGMRATIEEITRRQGWPHKKLTLIGDGSPEEAGKALCSGKTDAMIYAAGHPNGALKRVTSLCKLRLLDIDTPAIAAMLKENPFYYPATIPGGMYAGNPQAVHTFGVKAVLVASDSLPADMVYTIVKAVFDSLDNFRTLHPVFAALEPGRMVKDAAAIVPLHDGALRYYHEKALIP